MSKLDKKAAGRLSLLFALTYMVSYISRINYGAIVVEIQASTEISKSLLSMALTGSFITYGSGQIISGICGDKFSPKKLVALGLFSTALMNFLIPLCNNPYQMTAVWCVNGFAQSLMWPPLVRLMTTLFSDEDYKTATVKVSWGSSCGTILVYLLSPVIISLLNWKWVFIFSGACATVMIFFWLKYAVEIPREPKAQKPREEKIKEKSGKNILLTPLMLSIMLAIMLLGMLRDGVTTWMPSYISETYELGSALSILTGVLLPIFSIISFEIASKLYRRSFSNPILCAAVLFGAGAAAAFLLFAFSGANPAFSVFFSATLAGSMHGANLMLVMMLPAFFKKSGNVSTVSGVLNSCVYIGSAVSTYGIALLTEKLSWSYTLAVWLLIAAAGTAICFVCAKPWQRQTEQDELQTTK